MLSKIFEAKETVLWSLPQLYSKTLKVFKNDHTLLLQSSEAHNTTENV